VAQNQFHDEFYRVSLIKVVLGSAAKACSALTASWKNIGSCSSRKVKFDVMFFVKIKYSPCPRINLDYFVLLHCDDEKIELNINQLYHRISD
jgi:hypothetical protein